ncbi:MAG TPA: tetratricopeptide repeat protein [Terriglobia bacterium]|nr:tetratricopeptide repeat protein [Terriglobia bacterium]
MRTRPALALSMIVKDGAATLARCLDSVRGVVDEIVIADTGSSDQSREIAAQFGAKVFSIAWEDDFAKARNESLARVSSGWVLMLDADEILDPEAGKVLRALLKHTTIAGYMTSIRNYVRKLDTRLWDQQAKPNLSPQPFAREYPAYVEHQNVRLFRRHPDVRFTGRVHETVGFRIAELGMKIAPAGFLIHHLGFVADSETLAKKTLFYREMGRRKVRESPDDVMSHFELGIEEFEHFRDYEEAVMLFRRACEINPRFGVAWLFQGKALAQTGKHREALACYQEAEDCDPCPEMVKEARGDAYYSLGDFDAARRCFRKAIERQGESPQLQSKLGFTEIRLGDVANGVERIRRALERAPEFLDIHDRLIAAYTWLGQLREAAQAAERKLTADQQPGFFLRAASLYAQLEDWPQAAALARQGLTRFPGDEKLSEAAEEAGRRVVAAGTEAKGDAAYNAGDFESACQYYQRAIERLGSLPPLESKLGIAQVRLGRAQEGIARLCRALEQNPQAVEIYDRLISACIWLGRLQEAAAIAEKKIAIAPLEPESYLRAASLRAQLQDWPRVEALLRQGLDRFPKAEKLRKALAELEARTPGAPGA